MPRRPKVLDRHLDTLAGELLVQPVPHRHVWYVDHHLGIGVVAAVAVVLVLVILVGVAVPVASLAEVLLTRKSCIPKRVVVHTQAPGDQKRQQQTLRKSINVRLSL